METPTAKAGFSLDKSAKKVGCTTGRGARRVGLGASAGETRWAMPGQAGHDLAGIVWSGPLGVARSGTNPARLGLRISLLPT